MRGAMKLAHTMELVPRSKDRTETSESSSRTARTYRLSTLAMRSHRHQPQLHRFQSHDDDAPLLHHQGVGVLQWHLLADDAQALRAIALELIVRQLDIVVQSGAIVDQAAIIAMRSPRGQAHVTHL